MASEDEAARRHLRQHQADLSRIEGAVRQLSTSLTYLQRAVEAAALDVTGLRADLLQLAARVGALEDRMDDRG